jgi:hypothetical protein
MPKVCPKCQAVNGGFVVRCACGFDLSKIEVAGLLGDAQVAPDTPATAGRSTASPGWADFFLRAGQLLALLGCAGSVVGAPLAIALSPRDAALGAAIPLAVLGGVLGLCYWAAMYVVFAEVLRLRGERAGTTGEPSLGPLPRNAQTRGAGSRSESP